VLTARSRGIWGREYDIEVDGTPVTSFRSSWWGNGGTFTVEGHEYTVKSNAWGAKFGMAMADGTVVARAEKVGRKNWSVDAEGRTLQFRRTSMWSAEQALMDGDREVGSIRKRSMWRNDAVADLPGLDPALQIFVVAVVVTHWEQSSAAAAASS
jgi:hypothetical protein